MATSTKTSLLLLALAAGCSTPSLQLGGPGGGPGVGGGVGGGGAEGCAGTDSHHGGIFPCTPRARDDGPVVEPARPPPPISGGTLIVLADGTVIAADPDRDLVYVISPTQAIRTVRLEPNDEPGRVTAGPPGTVFVALRRAAVVVQVDVGRGNVLARHPVCPAPRGLAWSQDRQTLYVACATGDLAQLVFDDGALVSSSTSQPAADLRDVMVTSTGVLLTTFRDARVLTRAHDGTVMGQPSPGTQNLVLGNVAGFGGGPGAPPTFVPRVAWRTVMTPTAAVMVHQRAQVGPMFTGGYGTVAGGPGTVHTMVTRLTATGIQELGILPGAVLAVDLAVSADEQRIAVASAASGVWLWNTKHFTQLFSPATARDGQITAVGFRGEDVVAFSREPAALHILDIRGKARLTLALSDQSVRSTGHELFHAATRNAISCASCHPEGGEDGHVWSLPEGPRRTPSLRGGLIGTEPFHWNGDQSNIGALMSEVFARRMGGDIQSPERSAAVLAWMDAQPRLPPPSLDAAAVERGAAVFASPAVGCASCHSGRLGTNNANASVGTGRSFQVPRLVELAHRAPFFHDGRVSTLAARFTAVGGGDLHGQVNQLSPGEVSDLVEYLRSR